MSQDPHHPESNSQGSHSPQTGQADNEPTAFSSSSSSSSSSPSSSHPKAMIAFAHESPARLLVDYLNSQQIPAFMANINTEQNSQQYNDEQKAVPFVVVIRNENQTDAAKKMCDEFLANPNDKRFQSAAWETGQTISHTQPVMPSSHSVLSQLRVAPVTFAIVLLCVVVYALFNIEQVKVFEALRFQPVELLSGSGQWWRLWSPAVIHFSVLHIVFNLLWWWSLGKDFERLFGHVFIGLFFLTTALLSNYAQFWVSGNGFGGLSGVVYAMFGCVWWLGWLRPQWGLNLSKPVIGFMLVWLVLGYADVLFVSMANTAHTVGLVSGCVIALLLVSIRGEHSR